MSEHPILGQLPDLSSLLQSRGAKLVGRDRFDCPECHGRRTGSYHGEAFFCHRCEWKGNAYMLAKEQGLLPEQSPEQAREYGRQRELSQQAAALSCAARNARRSQLYDSHQSLLSIQAGASKRLSEWPEDETAWSALAHVEQELPRVRAELLLLEDASFSERRAFMRASDGERNAAIDRILASGGLTNPSGQFVELVYG